MGVPRAGVHCILNDSGDSIWRDHSEKQDLEAKMDDPIKSSAVILTLYDIYDNILGDSMAHLIQPVIPAELDTPTPDNYFLLLFTICKVCFLEYSHRTHAYSHHTDPVTLFVFWNKRNVRK